LAAETGFIAGATKRREALEEVEENGFEEVPVIGASGEEGAEPEFGALGLVEIEGSEVALAGGSDVEAQTECGRPGEEVWEFFEKEVVDLALAFGQGFGAKVAEPGQDLAMFEVEAFDGVVGAAEFDGRPIDDTGGARDGVAQVGLLEDFFGAGAGLAVGEELVASEARAPVVRLMSSRSP
jgi:hypothetical protein